MRQYRILLVESDLESSRRIRFLMHLAGYQVTTTPSLDEAVNRVKQYRKLGEGYDLLLVNQGEEYVAGGFPAPAVEEFPLALLVDRQQTKKIQKLSSDSTGVWACSPDDLGFTVGALLRRRKETLQ